MQGTDPNSAILKQRIIRYRKYSLLIGWTLINLSQIVSIAEQLKFNCIGHIWAMELDKTE